MAIKCIKIFLSKALQNFPQIGIFGLKINHLAILVTIVLPPRPKLRNNCTNKTVDGVVYVSCVRHEATPIASFEKCFQIRQTLFRLGVF
jgi:hypothetical protein